jgi:hypothetical protein
MPKRRLCSAPVGVIIGKIYGLSQTQRIYGEGNDGSRSGDQNDDDDQHSYAASVATLVWHAHVMPQGGCQSLVRKLASDVGRFSVAPKRDFNATNVRL